MPALAMPYAGLTFADVSLAALNTHGNRRRTAKRLGVSIRALDACIERHNLGRWFVAGRGKGKRPRARCVTVEQIIEVAQEGYHRRDVAEILGISYAYLKDIIEECNLQGHFISAAQAKRIARRGYV